MGYNVDMGCTPHGRVRIETHNSSGSDCRTLRTSICDWVYPLRVHTRLVADRCGRTCRFYCNSHTRRCNRHNRHNRHNARACCASLQNAGVLNTLPPRDHLRRLGAPALRLRVPHSVRERVDEVVVLAVGVAQQLRFQLPKPLRVRD